MEYDFVLVGSGLFNATFGYLATQAGKKCLVIEKRSHIGGNIYTENLDGINVHKYGAHIFHTDSKKIWDFINQFAEFNRYTNSPVANYKDRLFNLPFNMNTFTKLWPDIVTPEQVKERISEQSQILNGKTPENLEEQAISLVGSDIYHILIKGYTEKQWGKPCSQLPPSIIKRIPVRFTFDNNYFNDKFQGIPIGGYTQIIEKMLKDCTVLLNTDFFEQKEKWLEMAPKIIYTGTIDRFFEYCYGTLEYRTSKFETQRLEMENFQGNAVVNYTDSQTPYTRIVEHKYFEEVEKPYTYISKEFPYEWEKGDVPFYVVNDEKNEEIYKKYVELAKNQQKVLFGGRLGMYKYFDMDDTIEAAMNLWQGINEGTVS